MRPAPKLLIIDEPTRGIDVGTKSEVHRLLSELAGEGLAVLMISSELPEVLGMADRVLVMREGRITARSTRATRPRETVMFAATHRGRSAVGMSTQPLTQPGVSFGARLAAASARETGIIIAFVVVVAITTIVNPTFLF